MRDKRAISAAPLLNPEAARFRSGKTEQSGNATVVEKSYEQDILEHLRELDADNQRRVLEYVKTLKKPQGIPGWLAVQYADEINFPPEDLAEIKAALRDFEEIDLSEWDLPS